MEPWDIVALFTTFIMGIVEETQVIDNPQCVPKVIDFFSDGMSIDVGRKNSGSNTYTTDTLLAATRITFNFYNVYLFCPEFIYAFVDGWTLGNRATNIQARVS